jgi:hypothetical protein
MHTYTHRRAGGQQLYIYFKDSAENPILKTLLLKNLTRLPILLDSEF